MLKLKLPSKYTDFEETRAFESPNLTSRLNTNCTDASRLLSAASPRYSPYSPYSSKMPSAASPLRSLDSSTKPSATSACYWPEPSMKPSASSPPRSPCSLMGSSFVGTLHSRNHSKRTYSGKRTAKDVDILVFGEANSGKETFVQQYMSNDATRSKTRFSET